jgi:hypothetical protein
VTECLESWPFLERPRLTQSKGLEKQLILGIRRRSKHHLLLLETSRRS